MKSLKGLGSQFLDNTASNVASLHHFEDIDEFSAFLPEDVHLTLLEGESFKCKSADLDLGALQFNFNHVNRKLHAFGQKQRGFLTFSMILEGGGQDGVENERLVTENHVFGFDSNREADLVFPGNAIYCAIYIHPDIFETYTQAMDRLDLDANFLALNYVDMPEAFPPLRTYLKQVYELLYQHSLLLEKPDFQRLIWQDFLPLFIASLPAQQKQWGSARVFRRSQLVKQAEDYMRSHIDQPLTLTDLCQALGTSSRALCYGFQEIFGTSPMAYLKLLRLQSVNRSLKAAQPDQKTVTEIATQFGFYHLGYLARDYKKMFGELPSETLNRNP
jgi:AraC family ethanolamine operon transcriptional activator